MRGWNSGLNHIADQQVRSPSSRQVFLSSEGSMASFHEISSIDSSSSVLDSVQKLLAVQLNNFGWFSWLPCTSSPGAATESSIR